MVWYSHRPIIWIPIFLREDSNVTQLDVFSRLMMDRIIFLGTSDWWLYSQYITGTAFYLDSVDPGKDYLNLYYIPRWLGVCRFRYLWYHAVYFSSDVATICTGMAAFMAAVMLVEKRKRSALTSSRVMIHQPMVVHKDKRLTLKLQ